MSSRCFTFKVILKEKCVISCSTFVIKEETTIRNLHILSNVRFSLTCPMSDQFVTLKKATKRVLMIFVFSPRSGS